MRNPRLVNVEGKIVSWGSKMYPVVEIDFDRMKGFDAEGRESICLDRRPSGEWLGRPWGYGAGGKYHPLLAQEQGMLEAEYIHWLAERIVR